MFTEAMLAVNDDIRCHSDPVNLDRLSSALWAIRPQGHNTNWRKLWLECLWSFQDGGGSLEEAIQWSQELPGYTGDDDVIKAWNSFEPDGGIHVGTLFHIAQTQYGWEHPTPNTESNDAFSESTTAGQGTRAPYKLLNSADLAALPSITWRVHGVLPAIGYAALYGPSGSGKSFLALNVACAIALGSRWFSNRVHAAPVIYVALEGEAGMKLRVQAWEVANNRKMPENMHLVLQPFKLTSLGDIKALAEAVPHGAVLFLDTLNRAAPTADENSSSDMGEILEATKTLQRLTGGLVVLVHHTGKDTTKGLRGHSSLIAAMDATIEVSRVGDKREWLVAKAKDGEDGKTHPFRLKIMDLGHDSYGDALTSCVVETVEATAARTNQPQGEHQVLATNVLRPLISTGVQGKPGAPVNALSIQFDAAVAAVAPRLPVPSSRRMTRAKKVINDLVGRGVLGFYDGWLWLP
ncbi:MAG: AAA family ATPase [Rhodoferax sp.]|nr:AAA family ATPase [Rhodoferax sp.]